MQSMKQKLGQLFGGISLWSSGALLPISQATSSTVGRGGSRVVPSGSADPDSPLTVGVQRICGWCRQLVANITSCCRSLLSWCTQRIADAQYYRDWSYEQVGIKSDLQKDGDIPVTARIRLRKQIKGIEDILTSSKKSDLLNQSSSSSTKDGDKESSRNCTVKENSSEQKETEQLSRDTEREVFGRDKDRADISRMLREGPDTYAASSSTSKPYSVIGIYGITGSGKSTLAQYVCHDEKKAGHFDPIMFIHVGKTFRVGDIFRDMLKQITQISQKKKQITQSRPPNDEDLKCLKTKLEEALKGKLFLLVLDDLWVNDDNQNGLDILIETLSTALSGSRVLVTAQKEDAAGALAAHLQPFPIPDLEEEVYLSLLMHHAGPFASYDNYGEYESIGREIAKRLHRSTIAAVTVGKRLQNKRLDFWKTTANLDVLNKTMGALWWSYQQLGVDVRRCFAYCSIFPSGYELEQDELVRIWIAQGFVNTRNNATEELEDIGKSYIDQLLTFSFLQVQRTYFGKETEAFTIHDLLHELAERVSRGDFFRISSNDTPKVIPRGVHHLFIETNSAAKIAENIVDMENLRTLIIKEPPSTMEIIHDSQKFLGRLFMRLTNLRVLVIKVNFSGKELSVPACIDHMKHLRYLGLQFNILTFKFNLILPSTFSKLYHLCFVVFPQHFVQVSCPQDMANLIYLQHIPALLSFPHIGRLTSLQTLEKFLVKKEPGHELKQLMHLNSLRGSLSIWGLGVVESKDEALEANLTHKKGLRRLELHFGRNKRDPDVEAEVLEGLCPPKDIQQLRIWQYWGSRYPSWMLSRQGPDAPMQLHRLELCCCSQLAYIPQGSELFISLRKLCIKDCDWDSLPENMERLVSLQTLEIRACRSIEHLPTLPQAIKEIVISECYRLRRLEFVWEKDKRLEACTSMEHCQDTAPISTPEQSPYPIIPCPCLVSLEIRYCANLVTLTNLPPSLKKLLIDQCGELCSMSGQLGQLERLYIYMCNKLQSVDSLGDASSLEALCLSRCQCLTSLGSSGGPASYLALRDLRIKDCPAMDMKQFNKNVLDGLVSKDISHTLSSNPDERA